MSADRRGRRFAGFRLDQPGIDQDQAVEPGLAAEQGERGRAVAQAEADDPFEAGAFAPEGGRGGGEVGP